MYMLLESKTLGAQTTCTRLSSDCSRGMMAAAVAAAAARVLRGRGTAATRVLRGRGTAAARVLLVRGTAATAATGFSSAILSWLPVKNPKRHHFSSKRFSSSQAEQEHHKPPLLLTLQCDYNLPGEVVSDEKPTILRFSSYNNDGTLIKNFFRKPKNRYYLTVMQSCQGLVCISPLECFNEPILICNPTTEETISLPPTTLGRTRSVGFGFAASTQEFKVVRFFLTRDWKHRCQVFTLGTDRWREVPPPPYPVFIGRAPFLDGAIHFLPEIPFSGRVEETDNLGAFDVDTEEYKDGVPLPAEYYNLRESSDLLIRGNLRLSKLGGSLCLTFDYGEMKCRLDMWLLKDYKNAEWVNGHIIDVSALYPYPSYCFKAYPVDTIGDDVLLSCVDEDGVNLLVYNLQEDATVKVKKAKEFTATYYVENSYPLINQR